MGYTSASLEAGKWYLIGSNFQNTDGTSINIQDLVKGLTPGSDSYDSPVIQYWDGANGILRSIGYFDFVWIEDIGDFGVAWADLGGEYVSFDAEPGFGCWIKVPTAATITCAGQVVSVDSLPKTITANWQLISNPYPISMAFNDASRMDCSELTPGSDSYDSPVIQYWDGESGILRSIGYFDFVWIEDIGDFGVAWADLGGDYSPITLPPCTGFWVKSPSGGTISFKK